MSRRSSKQSNVVPISPSDELDDLMSSESIKPNLSFLGLDETEGRERESDHANNHQPRLIVRSPTGAVNGESEAPPSSPIKAPVAGLHKSSPEVVGSRSATGVVIAADAPLNHVPISAPAHASPAPNESSKRAESATGADIGLARPSYTSQISAPGADEQGQDAAAADPAQSEREPGEGKALKRPAKIHKCTKAQDGHSHIEDVLYGVLRRSGRPEDDSGNVITQLGSSVLCRETRVHKRNLGTLLRRLVFKQSIEILDHEQSHTRTARRFRVFSYTEILKRRRQAGLEWVVRRRGVEFVNPATGEPLFRDSGPLDGPSEITPPGAASAAPTALTASETRADRSWDSDAVRAPEPHAVTASPLGKETREAFKGKEQKGKDTTTSINLSLISEELQKYWQTDEAAVHQLVRSCVATRPDCTTEEIAHFIEEKGYILSKNARTFTNPVGFLLSSVPKCFEGQTFERWRERQRLAKEHRLEEEQRQKEEAKATHLWFLEHSKMTLANPKASAVERARAQRFLDENPIEEEQGE